MAQGCSEVNQEPCWSQLSGPRMKGSLAEDSSARRHSVTTVGQDDRLIGETQVLNKTSTCAESERSHSADSCKN